MDIKIINKAKWDIETILEESFRQFDPAQVVKLKEQDVKGVLSGSNPNIIDASQSKVVIRLGPYENSASPYLCAKLPRSHLANAGYLRNFLNLINIVGGKLGSDIGETIKNVPYHFVTEIKNFLPSEETALILREIGFPNVVDTKDVELPLSPKFCVNISEDLTEGGRYILHPAKGFPYHDLGWKKGAEQFDSAVNRLISLNNGKKYRFGVDRGHLGCDEKEAAERMFFVVDDPRKNLLITIKDVLLLLILIM